MTAAREIVGAFVASQSDRPPCLPTRTLSTTKNKCVFPDSPDLYLAGTSPREQTQGQHQRRYLVMNKVPAPPGPSISS
jgi:hypothetical protein